jgi:hypothetical protein
MIHSLLTEDAVCRKLRTWSLLTPEEMSHIWTNTTTMRSNQYGSSGFEGLLVQRSNIYNFNDVSWNSIIEILPKVLDQHFPLSTSLLKRFKGKMVAAGGAIFRALHGMIANDMDFFFIDMTPENATSILLDALQFMISSFLPHHHNTKAYVFRSEYVTTLHLYHEFHKAAGYVHYKYQFIHRIYPNVGSILGGFDLGPCMIAFDGHNLLATRLGAWCAFSRAIIVDTTRRSTTFESRLSKYHKMCHVIFPGLRSTISWLPHKNDEDNYEPLEREINRHLAKFGYKYMRGSYEESTDIFNKIWSKFEHILDKRKIHVKDRTEFEAFLRENLEDSDGNLISIDRSRDGKLTDEDLDIIVSEICKKNGYYLQIDSNGNRDFQHSATDKIYLKKLTISKDMGIRSYYSDTSKITSVTLEGDYDNRCTLPEMISTVNGSMLRSNKFNYVCSSVVLAGAVSSSDIRKTLEDSLYNISITSDNLSRRVGALRTAFGTSWRWDQYRENVNLPFKYIGSHLNNVPCFKRRLVKLFAEYADEVFAILSKDMNNFKKNNLVDALIDRLQPFINIMNARAESNIQIVKERLKGIKWITDNPGRQWTSSINPIIEDPRDWYNSPEHDNYTPFITGYPEHELTLRLLRLRCPLFKHLNRDLMNIILAKFTLVKSLKANV